MRKTFYSNGKLLITGEYVVLDGAKALALPTKSGQNLAVENGSGNTISWKSYDADGSVWFEDVFHFSEISGNQSNGDDSVRGTLLQILQGAFQLQPNFLTAQGYKITTGLTFPKIWGLGTSSTLINNLAQWLGINAYELLQSSFGGSGYDIACARHNTPIIYQLQNGMPQVEPVLFNPEFKSQIWFVYLNRKQSSKTAIAAYRSIKNTSRTIIPMLDMLTEMILLADNIGSFCNALDKHEAIIADTVGIRPVRELLFPDFKGSVKSLGAWGGDFVMAVSTSDPRSYFSKKGYQTVISYHEMIL